MFKRVERKRRRREEEEELGLDEDTKQISGLNDTDSDESDSQESAQSVLDSDPGIAGKDDRDQNEDIMSEDRGVVDEPLISVEEALKNPIYLISFDPTVHGCVLCREKVIKNVGMATAHKNANVHIRRFEQFSKLSADANPRSNAWELIKIMQSASGVQETNSHESSKRALKRRGKQAAIRGKRKQHKELKAKAMAKKALKKLSVAKEARPVVSSKANLRCPPVSQDQPKKKRKDLRG